MYFQNNQHSAASMPRWDAPGAGSSVVSWNGGNTVAAANNVSQYQSHQQNVTQQQPQNNNNVDLYTRYYHGWKAVMDSPATASQKQWASYYSDLSSRLAHHFHQNPFSVQPPPQFEIPPAPPNMEPAATATTTNQTVSSSIYNSGPQPVNNNNNNGAFQVFVDKCLQQCKTPAEKESMVQSTKQILQKAIQEGNLHTKDWSLEPLLVVASAAPLRNHSPVPGAAGAYQMQPFNVGHGKKKKKHQQHQFTKKRPHLESSPSFETDSYYGPSSASSSSSPSFSAVSPKRVKLPGNGKGFNASTGALNRRAQRFASSFQQPNSSSLDSSELDERHEKGPVIIGTCKQLEKEYLRLTAAPKAELVRPQPVLEEHFANLQKEYADLKYRRDYLWFCSQLKAIRQDCTVQHLKNEFCVKVYEFHATVALEQGDLNEFNQCQTQLKYLYPSLKDSVPMPNRSLFLSYRILYAVYLNLHNEEATIDMKDIFGEEVLMGNHDAAVKHAMMVLSAAHEGNYHIFFSRLYPSKHGHQDFLLEKMVPVLQKKALQSMCGAYRPTLDVEFVLKTLQVSDITCLEQMGCVLESVKSSDGQEQQTIIKTKESQIKDPENSAKSSKLM